MNNYGIPQNAVITIAGTVGVGKSTLTQALADKLNFKTSFENVDHNPYELFNAMVMTPYFPKPDVLIYLECDYDEVIDRIQQRGRDMEINTDPEYWKKLFKRYENWINNFNACPVVRLNINEYDIHEDLDSLDPVIDKIAQVIKAYRQVDTR